MLFMSYTSDMLTGELPAQVKIYVSVDVNSWIARPSASLVHHYWSAPLLIYVFKSSYISRATAGWLSVNRQNRLPVPFIPSVWHQLPY